MNWKITMSDETKDQNKLYENKQEKNCIINISSISQIVYREQTASH